MRLFDDIKRGLDRGAEAIGTAAARQAEAARLRRELGDLRREIEKQTLQAGQRAVEMHAAGQLSDSGIAQAALSIKEREARVAELEAALQRLAAPAPAAAPGAAAVQCAKCGATLPSETKFCKSCGAAVPRCAQCKAPLGAGDAFCAGCGSATPQPPSQPDSPPEPPTG